MKNYLKHQGQSVWVTLQYSDVSSDNSHIWPLKYLCVQNLVADDLGLFLSQLRYVRMNFSQLQLPKYILNAFSELLKIKR